MINRRELFKGMGATAALSLLPGLGNAGKPFKPAGKFTYCLNMATIRGHQLGFVKELEVAAEAGFRSVEIWIDTLQKYLDKGGTLADAKKRLNDLGVVVENCIGFAPWIVEDEATRKKGLEQMKREMDVLAQIGCKRTAAPPVGATQNYLLDLKQVGARYRAALEIGDKTGVIPQLEMWGFSTNLSRVSEVMFVALESGHPSAKVLLDIFHLYKGGSSIETLPLVSSASIDILHMNDYPTNLRAANITDADRIYPGDGIAPIHRVLQTLQNHNKPLILSVEVFNKNYYKQDSLVVTKTALAKLKAVVQGL